MLQWHVEICWHWLPQNKQKEANIEALQMGIVDEGTEGQQDFIDGIT